MSLTLTALPGIPLIQSGDDLAEIILQALKRAGLSLQDGDILVLAQKIVSKAEGRMLNLNTLQPSPRAEELAVETGKDPRLVEAILRESNQVLRYRKGTIIVEHSQGFICASAGVDHSNIQIQSGEDQDWVLLLPENADASAAALRQRFEKASGARLGVLIIDSHGRAWRLGTVGITIGLSGLPGVVDLRGQPDLRGFRLQITEVGVADELAAAASLVMGQAAEGTPAVHVRGFPYALRDSTMKELLRPREEDLFR
jgi:coenzyme F420-0:L-glutamate ligase/coenzyme F420-1:gamma-L-glutamate ligase